MIDYLDFLYLNEDYESGDYASSGSHAASRTNSKNKYKRSDVNYSKHKESGSSSYSHSAEASATSMRAKYRAYKSRCRARGVKPLSYRAYVAAFTSSGGAIINIDA